MSVQSYALGVGYNNSAGAQNIENLIYDRASKPRRFQLRADPLSPGGITTITLDQKSHKDATQIARWRYVVLPLAGLDTLVTTFIGNWDTDNGAVTLYTRKLDNTFAYYNAEFALPEGFRIQKGTDGVQYARDIELIFRVISAI